MHRTLSSYLSIFKKMRDTTKNARHMKTVAFEQNSQMFSKCEAGSVLKFPTDFDRYLIPTEGMQRSDHGQTRFYGYVYRAKWYPYPLETHDQALGMIQNQPPFIDLPAQMEYLKTDATSNHDSLESVLGMINSEQIIVSRYGILSNPTGDNTKPFNTDTYHAESIIDWRESIAKSGNKEINWLLLRTDYYDDDNNPIYLVLLLNDGVYSQYKTTNKDIKPEDPIAESDGFIADSFIVPEISERPFNKIPFTIINVKQLGTAFEKPWLESISDASIDLFQASASYENTLHYAGDSIFTGTGIDTKESARITAGAGGKALSSNKDAKFGWATAGADGAEPKRANVELNEKNCKDLGVDLVNQGVESGVALETRTNIKTASLMTLAKTGAEGLQFNLRMQAEWSGLNPDDVVIVANTEFGDKTYTLTELKDGVQGGVFVKRDLYDIMKKQGLTTFETFEEWDELHEKEDTETTVL